MLCILYTCTKVNVFHLQRQPNYSDCGVFAVAKLMQWLFAMNNKLKHQYDVNLVRMHLAGCIEDRAVAHTGNEKCIAIPRVAWTNIMYY